ncbi:MAG: septation protein SepH [Nocardioides sp.]
MIQLSIAGVSSDGSRLLLVSDDGSEYTVAVDAKLRAALRGDQARIGQLEIQMESALRPRDIQARIRAGETPESVAQVAQTTIEAIMPYAGPVLAERAHVADRAQRASLRRVGDSTPSHSSASHSSADDSSTKVSRQSWGQPSTSGGRTLGEAVSSHLRPQHVDPDTVRWDAWRREDGRWMLTATFTIGPESRTARFAFDAPGNYVTIENDDAMWLVGDRQADSTPAHQNAGSQLDAPVPEANRDDLDTLRRRRLSAVSADDLPRDKDAAELTNDLDSGPAAEQAPAAASEPLMAARPSKSASAEDETEDLSETVARIRTTDPPPRRREVSKNRGRASVPSWDEIMFGSSKGD